MVLKNLFTGQQWRSRHREQTYGRGERVRCMERVTHKFALQPTRICCMTQETQTRALYQPREVGWGGRGEGGSRGRGQKYIYG